MYRGMFCRPLWSWLLRFRPPGRSRGQRHRSAPRRRSRRSSCWRRLLKNWITNGGSVFNQRYSPLAQINRENVAGLKALWRTGMGSGLQLRQFGPDADPMSTTARCSCPTAPTMSLPWMWFPDRCCGPITAIRTPRAARRWGVSNRGVALGDGLVFVGQLDAKLIALDQRTGKLVWSVQVEPWQNGFSINRRPRCTTTAWSSRASAAVSSVFAGG